MGFLGFGYSSFGNTPFGFGAVPQLNSTTAQLLKKSEGTQGNAPYIDQASKDFVLDPVTGAKLGADSIPQMVQLAMLTLRGSSAVPNFGIDVPTGVFSPDMDKKVDAATRAALKHLTSKGLISIQKISFVRDNVRAGSISVQWVDLNTAETYFNTVKL